MTDNTLTKSGRIIIDRLEGQGRMSSGDIAKATGLSGRTIRFNINRLRKTKIIKEYISLRDTRRRLYLLNHDIIR